MQASDEQRAFVEAALERASMWMLDRTVPLFALAPGGNPIVEGTGVLMQIADAHFLVTAGHVVAGIIKDGRGLLVGSHGMPLLPLGGLDIQVSDDREDVDVAFMRLPVPVATAIAQRKSFLRLSEVDIERRPPRAGGYGVVGFPRGLQTIDSESRRVDADPFRFLTWLYEGELDRFTVGQSIALLFTPHSVQDYGGEHVRPPSLKGISGCGIWRVIGPDDGTPGLHWEPTQTIRLAGIEHGTVGSAIKGVLAFRVIDAIRQNHPDLTAAIDLHRTPAR